MKQQHPDPRRPFMGRTTLVVASAVAAVLGAAPVARGQEAASSRSHLYQLACAACHGRDGRGMPRSVVGFDVPLPDFTDCSFTTPEVDADWLAIAHAGGPVRSFDRRMPAFGEALTEAELHGILSYIRSLCVDPSWPRGELNLPRPFGTEKAFPENEAVLTTTIGTSQEGSVSNVFLYERRFGARNQFEVAVPFDVQEQSAGGWRQGIGDIAIAVKRAVYHDLNRGAIVSVAGELLLPTGSDDVGIGGGVSKLEPFLAYGQLLPRDSFVQLQSGVELSTNTSRAAHEMFWRSAVGRTFMQSNFGRTWTPMIEFLGVKEFDEGAGVHWDAVPQMQISLSRRQHVLLNVGIQLPLNDRRGRGTQVLTYLLWDWFDGGLFTGWR